MQEHVPSEPSGTPVRCLDRKSRGTEHRQRKVSRRQVMRASRTSPGVSCSLTRAVNSVRRGVAGNVDAGNAFDAMGVGSLESMPTVHPLRTSGYRDNFPARAVCNPMPSGRRAVPARTPARVGADGTDCHNALMVSPLFEGVPAASVHRRLAELRRDDQRDDAGGQGQHDHLTCRSWGQLQLEYWRPDAWRRPWQGRPMPGPLPRSPRPPTIVRHRERPSRPAP